MVMCLRLLILASVLCLGDFTDDTTSLRAAAAGWPGGEAAAHLDAHESAFVRRLPSHELVALSLLVGCGDDRLEAPESNPVMPASLPAGRTGVDCGTAATKVMRCLQSLAQEGNALMREALAELGYRRPARRKTPCSRPVPQNASSQRESAAHKRAVGCQPKQVQDLQEGVWRGGLQETVLTAPQLLSALRQELDGGGGFSAADGGAAAALQAAAEADAARRGRAVADAERRDFERYRARGCHMLKVGCGSFWLETMRNMSVLGLVPRLPASSAEALEGPCSGGRCGTCAVVGNAWHLLGARFGGDIDAHDVVVRFAGPIMLVRIIHTHTPSCAGHVHTGTTAPHNAHESRHDKTR